MCRIVLYIHYYQRVACGYIVDDAENHRKRRAVDEPTAAVKVSRQDDDVIDDVSSSPLHKNGNGDSAAGRNRKQSPLRCRECDYTADQRSALCRHVRRAHSRHQSPTSSPDVHADDDDEVDEVDVETEDIEPAAATPSGDDKEHRHSGDDLFCADCRIQFTSPSTYRAHHDFYCKARAAPTKRSVVADDARASGDDLAAVRRRRRTSDSRTELQSSSLDARGTEGLRQPTALFSSSLAPSAGLMEMLSAGVAPLPPPPPGAFFLAPFLAAAAAAAAAGVTTNGLSTATSPPGGARTLQPARSVDRRSSTSASDDEPLDLSTCRSVDVKINKHDSSSVSPASFARQFVPAPPDPLDPGSLFLPPSARLPLNAPLPLPVARPPMTSPPSISHCAECNIVFYKHANYLAHKAHYCAGRHAVASAGAQEQVAGGVPCPPLGKSAALQSKSDDVGRGGGGIVVDCDGRRRSPDPHELVATLDDSGTTLQFYCIPCKIKFSSLDTLRAHKQFYCPARFDATPSSGGELTTPARHRHVSRVYSSGAGSEDGERQTTEVQGAAGSCTACGTRLTSPRSGHRCAAAAVTPTTSLYQCPHCDYAAQSDSRLVEHVRAHAPSRAFRCALCGYRGNTVRGMRMHGKMHNDEAAAAAAGRAGGSNSAVQLPTFTDDCVIEYEEPPAIPTRRQSTASGTTPRPGVETELLRQKNEPYKRRRSRKAYEKAEYAAPPAASTTPVICAECSAPLLDTTHAAAHASAHAAERLLAWEALCKTASATASAAIPPADLNVDQRSRTSPVSDEAPAMSTLSYVKVEQADADEQTTTSANVINDEDMKCNGTDGETPPLDEQKLQREVHDDRTSSASPTNDVDATVDDVDQVSASAARRSSPPLTEVGLTRPAGRPSHPTPARRSTTSTSTLDVTSRYCEQCDITFMYASTFIAHKKYYCSSHAAERTDAARATAATAAAGVAAV